MFKPDDPFAPRGPVFEEPWHAQTLAIADAMVKAGHTTATDWANALGAALTAAEENGAPDTTETYYNAALSALESLTVGTTPLEPRDLTTRKEAWAKAYLSTPHGQPVKLTDV